jgi:hypothetical protein
MAPYEPGHPLHHASNTIDGEHSLEHLFGLRGGGAQAHALALEVRARQLGARVEDVEGDELHLVGQSGPELVHEARRAINHGYPVVVVDAGSSAADTESLVVAYRADGTFLVVGHDGGKCWEPGAFLMREGAQLSVVVARVRPSKSAG